MVSRFPYMAAARVLILSMVSIFAAQLAQAAPPIEQIRAIMAARDLWMPSAGALKALNERNLQAGLKAIDPYARYVPPPLPGKSPRSPAPCIGADIFAYKSRIWIRPDRGGPAGRTGVPEIGTLLAINGDPVAGTDLSRTSAMLDQAIKKGKVVLSVSARPGMRGATYAVRPERYRSPPVVWQRVGKYIVFRIREFVAHDTAPSLAALYKTLAQTKPRIIIDMRGCSGGDLLEAVEIAGMFVPPNLPLVRTHGRSGMGQAYMSPPGRKWPGPVSLLIDSRTASSAEILAGILRYYRVGRVIGEKSIGKCESQTLFPLSDGGGLWLTDFMIRFPDNSSCHGRGISPDIFYPDITVSSMADIVRRTQ